MASIEKRGANSWRLTVELGYGPNGERLRERKVIKVEDQALLKTTKKLRDYLESEWLKFKMEVEAGEYITPEKMTLATFIEEWRSKYAEKQLAPKTLKEYMGHINNHILPALGHKRLDEIKPMHIVTFLDRLSKPGSRKDNRGETLSGRTIQYIYAVMRNIFAQAESWKLIKSNPIEEIKKPKAEKKKAQYYDADEAQEVIKALYEEPVMWRLLILGAIIGGFRRGELVALEWPQVLFSENAIHIKKSISLAQEGKVYEKDPKNGEDRIVEMPGWYMEELRRYHLQWREEKMKIRDRWEGGDREYVFHAGYGKPLYFTYPSEWWSKFVKRHGLRYIRFHDLRHSSATLLIAQGASLKAIQERLGHKQHQTTADIYAHVTKKVSRDLADKFDQFDPKKQSI
ncbi:tyrosine-type recombinase/integrase [Brevibacillus sp. 1238]|uniref:tyrosine-type recombinase/integrase n=1 Tax=Brevibacillus sp. 1238 TaxID=2940565 RepID=UPI00247672BA|nr:tyrosine-type recombinase/integrase [Brevibacillus sp. 1238]MDH6351876.1 integrase [Brevibacillus sp. 1238]